jgi:acetoin utilization deacetylase AcuC-like enzyme
MTSAPARSGPRTAFLHDEACLWHGTAGLYSLFLPVGRWVQPPAGAGLADSPESKRRILSLLQVSSLAGVLEFAGGRMATEAELARVHPRSYLEAFKAMSDAGGGELGVVAPFGPGSYEIAKRAAGLALEAVEGVMSGRWANAYALARPGGHHCLPEQAMGFCLLSNVAIAVEDAIARHGLKRVAIVDWDVHHGNGTQAIFEGRSDVLFISLHQEGCFPPGYGGASDRGRGAGEGFTVNIPLLAGSGHDAYMYAFERIVAPVLTRFRPELIVVSSGLDANATDPLARMLATPDTYHTMTSQLKALAEMLCGGRLALVHEGGYSETVVPFCGMAVMEALCGERSDFVDPSREIFEAWQPGPRQRAFQRALIDELAEATPLLA